MTDVKKSIRAGRGTELECLGWEQEAVLRMLRNNLDPEVAEKPEDLIVYGGIGKAARNWDAFHAIERSLKTLKDDETLLIQSGKPVGLFRTHSRAPASCWLIRFSCRNGRIGNISMTLRKKG